LLLCEQERTELRRALGERRQVRRAACEFGNAAGEVCELGDLGADQQRRRWRVLRTAALACSGRHLVQKWAMLWIMRASEESVCEL
jgi:hypothetical protein